MSGTESITGFQVQALIAVVDALREESVWDTFTVEPLVYDSSGNYDKVDLLWELGSDIEKHVQIKYRSSLVGQAERTKWARELAAESRARLKELIVVGGATGSKEQIEQSIEGVVIKVRPDSAGDLLELAAQRIGAFCDKNLGKEPPARGRIRVARQIASFVFFDSTHGRLWSRREFEGSVLDLGRTEIYSPASILESPGRLIEDILVLLFGGQQPRLVAFAERIRPSWSSELPTGESMRHIASKAAGLIIRNESIHTCLHHLREECSGQRSRLSEAESLLFELENAFHVPDVPLPNAPPASTSTRETTNPPADAEPTSPSDVLTDSEVPGDR